MAELEDPITAFAVSNASVAEAIVCSAAELIASSRRLKREIWAVASETVPVMAEKSVRALSSPPDATLRLLRIFATYF